MFRLWFTSLGLLCLFAIVSAHRSHDDDRDDDDDDIHKRLGTMMNLWIRMNNNGRTWAMINFKMWISSNVHFRFVFSGTHLSSLNAQLSALMAANEGNIQEAVKELLRRLEASGVPKADLERFKKELRERCGMSPAAPPPAYPPKNLFIIANTTMDYNTAQSACHAKGGSLALLANSEEVEKAWKLVSGHKNVRFFVMARTLPERFQRMYPQLMRNEMIPSSGAHVSCLTMNPNRTYQFFVQPCSMKQAAMCEKYNLTAVNTAGIKGFVYYKDRETLQQAKQTCASIGGSLATINNLVEQKEAFGHLSFHGNYDAFIDASKSSGGDWLWRGKKSMPYKNWGPYIQTSNERCAVMERKSMRYGTSGKWRPVSCTSRNAFLCEVRVIPDSFVRLVDRHAMGKYFVGHSDPQKYDDAQRKCGHLAKIRTEEQLAAAMRAAKGIRRVHIGVKDTFEPGKFVYDDNSAVPEEMIQKRMTGFDARKKEHRCVVMDEHGRWLTASCYEKAGYLCEEPYQKVPRKPDYNHVTFKMDVRYDIPFAEVSRTTADQERFIRAAEVAIVKAIGGETNNPLVSSLKSGSTIVTYHFYSTDMRETFEKVKKAVESGRVVVYFNGRTVKVTSEQDYNYKQYLYVCGPFGPFDAETRRGVIAGISVGVIVFIAISIIVLVCCIKKRKILTARVASTVDVKAADPEKKGPPPDDEPLPPYKEAIAGDQPPPYYLPVATPPPPYNSEMPEVKT